MLVLSFCWYQNVLSPILAHPFRVRSCRRDLKLVEIEPVNEKVLRIKDYLVGSGRDGGSLCVLSAEDEIFFSVCHQISQMALVSPDN